MKTRLALLLFFLIQTAPWAQPPSPPFALRWVHGQCVGCRLAFELGRFQFLNETEAWATGSVISVSGETAESGGHVSQSSTMLHTSDGGRTWRRLKSVETYGVDVDPAFWFIDARRGWVAWPTAWTAEDHLVRSDDGGRSWRKLAVATDGTFVHLRFFDAQVGCAALSTSGGARFAVTRDGGVKWTQQNGVELTYPDVLFFLNPTLGWLGGTSRPGRTFLPRLLRTTDGGQTWRGASFPDTVHGDPHDLFFRDAEHGSLVLWNTDDHGSALLQTADGGQTWTQTAERSFQGSNNYLDAVRFLSAQVGFALMTKVRETSASLAALFSTRDGGRSWQRFALPKRVQSCEVVHGEVWCSAGMDVLKISPRL